MHQNGISSSKSIDDPETFPVVESRLAAVEAVVESLLAVAALVVGNRLVVAELAGCYFAAQTHCR